MVKINFDKITGKLVTIERMPLTGFVKLRIFQDDGKDLWQSTVAHLTPEQFSSLVEVIQSLENDPPEFLESQLPEEDDKPIGRPFHDE